MNSVCRSFAFAIISIGLTNSVSGQGTVNTVEQYVTRMEKRSKLIYEPSIKMVEKTFSRGSWNPFSMSKETQTQLIPVVRWVPRWSEETVPITERVTKQSPRWTAPQVAARSSGNLSIGRPTPTIQSRPIVFQEPSQFGGVQRLTDDIPSIGLRLRELR